jgi:PAS domain S-box-containing protein
MRFASATAAVSGVFTVGLAMATGSLGLWSAAGTGVWATLAALALLWPLPILRSLLGWQALGMGVAGLGAVIWLHHEGTDWPAGLGLLSSASLAAALGLARQRSPSRQSLLSLTGGAMLMLGGLEALGVFGGRASGSTLGAFPLLLACASIGLGSALLRQGFPRSPGLREGARMATAFALAAATVDVSTRLPGWNLALLPPLVSGAATLCLVAIAGGRRRLTRWLLLPLALLALATAAVWLAPALDAERSWTPWLPLTSGLALGLACLGLFALERRQRRLGWRTLAWASGLVLILIAALGFLGFLLETDRLNPWGEARALGPLDSLGHFGLGLALVLLSDIGRDAQRPLAAWLPATLGAMTVLIGVFGWRAVLPDNSLRIERASTDVAELLQGRLQQRLDLFARQLQLGPAVGDAAARILAEAEPAVIAIADPSGSGWQLRDPRQAAVLERQESRLRILFSGLLEDRPLEVSPLLGPGRPAWMIVSAASADAGQRLRLLVDAERLAESILAADTLPFAVELREQDSVILERRTSAVSPGAGGIERDLLGLGQGWTLRVAPLPSTVQLLGSRLPTLVLVMSILLGGSLAAALRLALVAQQRARKAEAIARGLEREVAARQATETALDRSLDEIGLILSSISDGFLFLDNQLRVSFTNLQASRMLLAGAELLPAQPLIEVWPELQKEGRVAQLDATLERSGDCRFEAFNPRSRCWLEVRAFAHPNGLALLLRDIGEQRERAEALASSEAALRGAQRLARVGSWRYDLHADSWLWSDELYRILGMLPGQLPPSRDLLLQHVPTSHRASLSLALDALLSEGREILLEHRVQRADGQWVDALSLARPERDSAGRLRAISGTLQDVSTQKQQAQELQAALARSERQARQLQALHQVSLLASQKLGDPDLVPTLLAEVRRAFACGVAMLMERAADAATVGELIVASRPDLAWPNALPDESRAFLLNLAESGPRRLSKVELLAQTAYGEFSATALNLPLSGLLCVGLRSQSGRRGGHLLLSGPAEGEFGTDELEVLDQFGQILALARDWAALIDALQQTRADLQQKLEALSRNRALLAGAERVAGLGTWELHFSEGQIVGFEASEVCRRILGLSDSEFAVDSAKTRLHPEDRARVREQFLQALDSGHLLELDYRIVHPDGRQLWVHTQAEIARDAQGRPVYLLGTMQDVSRQREAQQREQEKIEVLRGIAAGSSLQQSLRAIIEQLQHSHPVRVAITYDLDLNRGASGLEAPGLSAAFKETLLRLSGVPGIAPSRRAAERAMRVIVEDIDSDTEFTRIHAICKQEGVRGIVATPVLSADTRVSGILTCYLAETGTPSIDLLQAIDSAVSVTAIALKTATARRRLEDSRQRLRSLFTLVPDAVFALDPEGRIEDCNAAAEAATGRTRSALIGQPLTRIVPAELRALFSERIQLAALGGIQRFELESTDTHGDRIDAVNTTLPIEVDGATVGVFLIQTDVSEARRAQAALQAALSDLEARNQELQDFAFVASHDLQEPLRKVQAFGDRLRLHLADRLDASAADYIQRMRSAAARMQTLINDLLAYSRVSRNAHQPQRVALSRVLAEVLADLESRIEASGATIEANLLPEVQADPTQMRQLLQNLLGNALKFAHPGRRPRVRVSSANTGSGRVRLVIEDNGIGFDNKFQDRIFAPFQRLHGRSEYEGSGIGLAIVRKIVERHGGQIQARGRPGEGARFELDLPAVHALSSTAPV